MRAQQNERVPAANPLVGLRAGTRSSGMVRARVPALDD